MEAAAAAAQATHIAAAKEYIGLCAGATGATGRHVVKELLQSSRCTKVIALVRKVREPAFYGVEEKAAIAEKLQQVVVNDFEHLADEHKELFAPNTTLHAFWTLGSTKKKAGSAEKFRTIDFDVPKLQ